MLVDRLAEVEACADAGEVRNRLKLRRRGASHRRQGQE
jgi:hypothetical protein